MADAAAGAAVQAQFALIQSRFCAGLPARWQEIEAAPDATARSAALHRLAGAAGGFGFDALGELARLAMHADSAGALDAALNRLQAEIRRIAPD